MAKVIVKSLKSGRFGSAVRNTIGLKRVSSPQGTETVRTLDAHSDRFDEGLRYIFSKNVEKARRDNKRVTGSSDVAPRKR